VWYVRAISVKSDPKKTRKAKIRCLDDSAVPPLMRSKEKEKVTGVEGPSRKRERSTGPR
jgi:hypothetical protein